ncbi:unnamed protein product [Ceutorhynchus assimilis]|uniref:Uncharacterized protein n=1 Tax=Ceutorhynchus assimilis TaxID=467358 RepID=A0A9P0DPB2_9CUCU|nr:unnamed protein product [Ceutorhynchus assimilis]
MKTRVSKCKIFSVAVAAAVVVAVVIAVVWLLVMNKKHSVTGAVVSNGYGCADIGVSIFDKGGSAADAAIATLFCEGVSMPQSMGLGGGFLMTIYERETGTVTTLNARETAPSGATQDMFGDNATLSQYGGRAVAVPGELKGYWALYQKFGYLPWKDLVQPTIDLCNNGIYVTKFLAKVFLNKVVVLRADPVLREIFIDPTTNNPYLEGQYVRRKRLAKSLEIIAKEGADALYSANGFLIKSFVQDIQDNNGIISVDDMVAYEPKWEDPITVNFTDGHTLYTTPLPGSGAVLAFILNILDGFVDLTNLYHVGTYQRIVESFKHAYGQRTRLGDDMNGTIAAIVNNMTSKSFAEEIRSLIFDTSTSQNASYYGAETVGPEDHGTAHVSVLAPNGDAISVTSTINLVFGARFVSPSTGIILNDEMDDFSSPNSTSNYFNIPPSRANYIEPGKRPLSSMAPSIVVKGRDVVLVIGAAGGTKITSVVASIILKHIWYDVNLKEAIDEQRLHHQLFPMAIEYEEHFATVYPELVKNLTDIGHNSTGVTTTDGFSAVTSITAKSETIQGAVDDRRGGCISYTTS